MDPACGAEPGCKAGAGIPLTLREGACGSILGGIILTPWEVLVVYFFLLFCDIAKIASKFHSRFFRNADECGKLECVLHFGGAAAVGYSPGDHGDILVKSC